MAETFEMGSIADIVNSSGKMATKQQLQVKAEPQDESICEVKVESVKQSEEKPPIKGKKRPIDEVAVATENVAKKAKSPKKKRQRNKRKNSSATTEAPDNSEQEETEKLKLEKQARTLFIGNLSANFSMKNLKKNLSQFGSVANIRVRGVAPAKPNLSKKAAFLSKQINPHKKTVNAYVVFHVADSVQKALTLNGTRFEENVIQVDKVGDNVEHQNTFSVFLGNLSFKSTDNELREFFKDCGKISYVRLIRDSKTGIGKGFGYVNFKSKDAVVLALEKNGQTFGGREIRVKTYQYNQQAAKKGNSDRKSKSNFEKKSTNSAASPNKKVKLEDSDEKPNKEDLPKPNNTEFKGELSSKKLTKKNVKSRIKSGKLNKQKKKIAEILSK